MSRNHPLISWLLVVVLSVTGLVPASGMSSKLAEHQHAVERGDAYDDLSLVVEDCLQVIHCQTGSWLDTSFRAPAHVVHALLHNLPMMGVSDFPDWIADPVHPPPRIS